MPLGFRSFLDSANGKACSPVGTFGTSRRKNDLRIMCGSDTLYYPPDGVDTSIATASYKGTWRSEQRFKPLVDDSSPGPIYKIPEDLSKQKGLSWGKPPPKPDSYLPSLNKSAGGAPSSPQMASLRSTAATPNPSKSTRCTFGSPHRPVGGNTAASLPKRASSTGASGDGPSKSKDGSDAAARFVPSPMPSANAHIPVYKGRWGSPPKRPVVDEEEERRRRAKDLELLEILKQGFIQQQTYRSSTPSYSMGTRAAIIPPRTVTPGPNAYDVAKYKPDGRPMCPTFVGKGHNILEFQAGQDSPGPALYSQMRYPQ